MKPFLFRAKGVFIKNAPHILMGLGTSGSIGAVIFTAKAAPKAKQAIMDARTVKTAEKYDMTIAEVREKCDIRNEYEELTIKEKLKIVAPIYAPAIGMELFSLLSFWSAHGIDVHRQAVLAGLYSTAETALQEYQRRVTDLLGEKGAAEVRKTSGQAYVDSNPPSPSVILAGDTDMWCLYENQYFPSSYLKIKETQNDANHEMIQNMYISKAELMWMLDPDRKYLKPGPNDGQIGWSLDKMIVLDIQSVLGPQHQPVLMVTVTDKDGFDYPPEAGFSALH